ncbi:hypothetical protein ACFL9U_11355 [Thermodesulfobacteriota bacterium]
MLTVLECFLLISLAPFAFAEEKENPWSRFGFNLGGTLIATDGSVRLGAKGLGLTVDVNDFLGLDTSTYSVRADGYWRFTQNRRHRLDFAYYGLRQSGTSTLLRNIDIGDLNLPLGTTVDTSLKMDVFRLGYSYSFFKDDRMDLGIGAGLFVLPISFELTASGLANGFEEADITAPLPVVGLRFDFAITPKWFLRSNIDLFYIEIGDFKGSIHSGKLALEYNAFKNVGFGLSAESFRVKVEAEGGDYPGVDFNGSLEYQNLGLMAYVKFYFGK